MFSSASRDVEWCPCDVKVFPINLDSKEAGLTRVFLPEMHRCFPRCGVPLFRDVSLSDIFLLSFVILFSFSSSSFSFFVASKIHANFSSFSSSRTQHNKHNKHKRTTPPSTTPLLKTNTQRSTMSFLFDWFYGVLNFLGLYQKNATILFLGLDNAGKTTLLHMLKDERVAQPAQTMNPNDEQLVMGSIKFHAIDLGGHTRARRLWKDYLQNADCVVYVIDAAERSRFDESRAELAGLLAEPDLQGVPFLILGNKVDKPDAASEDELKRTFDIYQTTGKGRTSVDSNIRPIEIFMCSILEKFGYGEGFKWVSQYL